VGLVVGGWWDTGQQTQIEEKVLGSMGGRSRRMVGKWTANLDRRERGRWESIGIVGWWDTGQKNSDRRDSVGWVGE